MRLPVAVAVGIIVRLAHTGYVVCDSLSRIAAEYNRVPHCSLVNLSAFIQRNTRAFLGSNCTGASVDPGSMEIKGDVFRFDTISIRKEGVEPPQYRVYRVPVAVESQIPEEGEETGAPADGAVSANTQHGSVAVRAPFRGHIQAEMPEIERRLGVRMSLAPVDGSLLLIANGDRAVEAIEEVLNSCRRSKVYNYYLCFPVRGADFHRKFDELKREVRKHLGPGVTYEKRPHVTLALLNLVTDGDLDAVVKSLQRTALEVASLSEETDSDRRAYSVNLSGIRTIKYKGKAARRSVFMTNAAPEDTLMDIASEFQESAKRAINDILLQSHRNISKSRVKENREQKTIGLMTPEEAAGHGIHVSRGGNIEINFTDVAVVDPNGTVGDEEFNRMLAELHQKYADFEAPEHGARKTGSRGRKGSLEATKQEPGKIAANDNENANDVEQGAGAEVEEDCDDFIEHETSVTNEFHVTLLRNQRVEQLKDLAFDCQGRVPCVELRPRGTETCEFKAYTKGMLLRFVGNRYDWADAEEFGVVNIVGSRKEEVPQDLVKDPGTTAEEDAMERFVFWL